VDQKHLDMFDKNIGKTRQKQRK